jgi:DNA gyrase subunit A
VTLFKVAEGERIVSVAKLQETEEDDEANNDADDQASDVVAEESVEE